MGFTVAPTCISCDTCRQLAPQTFGGREEAVASVVAQPSDHPARRRALLALVSCPVAAIRCDDASKEDVRSASAALPFEVAPGVYRCGYTSRHAYAATAWLLRRPEGNVLVDSPRAARPLLARLRQLGGVRWIFLTHQDDVADHAVFAREFGANRIVHEADAAAVPGAERILRGRDVTALADDLKIIPVPGHTRGSLALLWKDEHLFSGDHIWWTDEDGGRLEMGRSYCWYSWREQLASQDRLAGGFRFRNVFPGHGRPWLSPSDADMQAALRRVASTSRTS